jgi:hypothetical protein
LDGPWYGLFMLRPRWHDYVIAVALLALGVAGTAALWGDTIQGWFRSDRAGERAWPSEAAPPPDTERM